MRNIVNLSGETLQVKTADGKSVEVPAANEELDRLIGAISLVTLEARGLSRESKRRLAQFLYAAGEMVSERTRLGTEDQQIFDAALREVAAKKFGL
jgi:hypothetical protein